MLDTIESATGLELAFGLVGALIGVVFVANWRGSLKPAEMKHDPRVKNLGWAVLVFLASFLGRWEKIFDLDDLKEHRLGLVVAYTLSLFGAVFAGLLIIAVVIYVRTVPLMRRLSRPSSDALAFVLDYLHYGYQYYRQECASAQEEPLSRFRELNAKAATLLAADILSVERYVANPSNDLRATVCKNILEHVCLIVQTYTEEDTLNANIMVAIPTQDAEEPDWALTQFMYQPRDHYAYLLMLRDYAYPADQQHFAVPVEDPARVPDWPDWTLLGAPRAFLERKDLVVQTSGLEFARNMPKDMKLKSQAYFKRRDFKSFACLIIPGAGDGVPRGILNVDSRREHIFEESEDIQNEIARALRPFCALLGITAK
jgi:hypothetical protein